MMSVFSVVMMFGCTFDDCTLFSMSVAFQLTRVARCYTCVCVGVDDDATDAVRCVNTR